jgi:hypothetical protein
VTAAVAMDAQRIGDAVVDKKNIAVQRAEQLVLEGSMTSVSLGQPLPAGQLLLPVGQQEAAPRSFARAERQLGIAAIGHNFSRPEPYHFDLLQQWEGIVQSVDGESFTVVLHDLTHQASEHEATLPVEEVSPGDRRLLKPGAVFYWSIGYKRHRSGQQERVSAIRMRRLPGWSRRDVEAVERRAAELESLVSEAGDSPQT